MNLVATANSNGNVDLNGKQGSTWALKINLFTDEGRTVPMSLAAYSARGQIKTGYGVSEAVASFVCEVTDDDAGEITISATAAITAEIPAVNKSGAVIPYVYDVEIYTGTPETVTRIMQGKLKVDPEVTT